MSGSTTSVVLRADDRSTLLRRLGATGVLAGLLFAAAVVWQYAASHGADDRTATAMTNRVAFAVALAGYVALGIGLVLAGPGGRSRRARLFPTLLVLAWAAFLVATALEALGWVAVDLDVLGPVGGLAQTVGVIGLGVTTAAAGHWSGWRRWLPLAVAGYYVLAVFVPAVLGAAPGVAAEAAWALTYSCLGAALWIEVDSRTSPGRNGQDGQGEEAAPLR